MKKNKLQIKSVFGKLLSEYEKKGNTFKDAVQEAIRRGADLSGANLRDTDLRYAYLRKANISNAFINGSLVL